MCVCVWFLIHFFIIIKKKQDEKKITESCHIKNYIKCNRKIDIAFFCKKNATACDKFISCVCILISIENFINTKIQQK